MFNKEGDNMKYVIYNLKSLIKNNKIIFILLVMCISVSTLIIQFSYGIYQNYHVTIEKGESEYTEIEIDFDNNSDNFVTLNDVLACVNQFPKNLYNAIDFCSVIQDQWTFRDTYNNDMISEDEENLKEYMVSFSFDKDGNFVNPGSLQHNYELNDFIEGNWFSDDEYDNENVCIIGLGGNVQRVDPRKDENNNEVFCIDYDGTELYNFYTDDFENKYRIVGCSGLGNTIFPVNSVSGKYRMDYIIIVLFDNITQLQYEELSDAFESTLGDYVEMPDLEFSESTNIYLYNSIILISIFISLAAGINFVILFHFILMKRRKKIAVMRLCGCTQRKAVLICLSECIILTLPLYIVFTILYDKVIIKLFENIYPYMESAFSIKIYIILGLIYFSITTLISFITIKHNITRSSIAAVQKEEC